MGEGFAFSTRARSASAPELRSRDMYAAAAWLKEKTEPGIDSLDAALITQLPDAAPDLPGRLRARISGADLDLTCMSDDEADALLLPGVWSALDAHANGIATVTLDKSFAMGGEPIVSCLRQLAQLRSLCIDLPLSPEAADPREIDFAGAGHNLQCLKLLSPYPPAGTRIHIPASAIAVADEAPRDPASALAEVTHWHPDGRPGASLPLGVREQPMKFRPANLAPLLVQGCEDELESENTIMLIAESPESAASPAQAATVEHSSLQAGPRRSCFTFAVNLRRHFLESMIRDLRASIKGDALDLSGWSYDKARELHDVEPQAWDAFLNDAKAAHLKYVVLHKELATEPLLTPRLQPLDANHFFKEHLPDSISCRLTASIKGRELDLTDWTEREVDALWSAPEKSRAVLLRDPRAADLELVAVNHFAAGRPALIAGFKQVVAFD
ncbi:MAG: hypothetical protein Q8R63_09775 [Ramlibacter sp.]|nr:hypothetical protein [Ramlibacter sp.]